MYYNTIMDDRKRQIDELERKKRDNTALLDGLLLRLGEELFHRIPDSAKQDGSPSEELNTYLRLQNDIAGSESAIEVIEKQIQELKELEEKIAARERDDKTCSKDLAGIYVNLGGLLLDSPPPQNSEDFCASYRSQAEALLTKVQSLEDRLSGLEQKEGGNVFTWIGNSAQSLVLRSFLTKAMENLTSLRRNVGERYSREIEKSGGEPTPEIEALFEEYERKRAESKSVSQELAALREERLIVTSGFSSDGSPAKQIQFLKKHITEVQGELKTLYRLAGAEAAGITVGADGDVTDVVSERRQFIESLLKSEDQETLDNAVRISRSIQNDEKSIARLRASLSIHEEQAKIEKFRRMIQDKRDKIAQAEKNIADYEEGIADCENYIGKLRELL